MLALGLLWALLLCGCSSEHAPQTEPSSQAATVPEVCTVQFVVQETVQVQRVEAGSCPVEPEAPEGYVIGSWLDGSGNAAVPGQTQITGDCTYTAVLYPDFYDHAPYLFPDEYGFIRPDAVLTGAELTAAMEALAPSDAVLAEMPLPEPEAPVTKQTLAELLDGLFPREKLERAFYNLAEKEVTRGDFARFMNSLLDRFANELLTVENGQALPVDLALDRADAEDILEASLIHTVSKNGFSMMDAVMEMQWQPGFANLGGWLYYADENGDLLRDGQVGTLTFGPDGRYTSGDAELDAIVAGLVAGFIAEAPGSERLDWLYTAFEYSRDSFTYVNKLRLEVGATGWGPEVAKQMFTEEVGNCFHYAAAFWALARGLGYDAECISGLALAFEENHGWVAIDFDGETYIFDPQTAMSERIGRRDNWGEDMFMVPDWDWYSWRYIWP